jgi:hypothetical protein
MAESVCFLEVVADIDERLLDPTWYKMLKATGLLRQLLLDESPLIHVVNRSYKLQVRFRVIDYPVQPPIQPDYHWMALDPELFQDQPVCELKLDGLLETKCLRAAGTDASVKDVIQACAKAMGGVHFGQAHGVREQAVVDFENAVRILGEESSTATTRDICRIALRGLSPLVRLIGGPRS